MNYISIIIILFFSLSCAHRIQKKTDRLSIIQGLTSNKEVEFSILANKSQELTFELKNEAQKVILPTKQQKVVKDFSEWTIYKALFSRDQAQDYNLFVYDKNKLIDQRLIGKGQQDQSQLKLIIASCMNDELTEHFPIWNQVLLKNPEYLLMIGDNVYADRLTSGESIKSTPETIWNRYLEVRLSLPIFFFDKLIPIHALWDDQDYGVNDGNSSFEYKEESKDIFEAFYAQSLNEENWSKGFGVGGLLSLGNFNLYFLDGRSFRSSIPEGSHLGIDQTLWLMKTLKEEHQPSFIIKGDQFFGGYHRFESFEGSQPREFSEFIEKLKNTQTPATFISGDRHLSEVMQFPRSLFGLPAFEITSSPIHAKLFPGSEVVNPWRVVHNDSQMNFTYVHNVAKDNHWFMDVENINEKGNVVYRRELAVYIKDLQNNLNEARKRRNYRRKRRR